MESLSAAREGSGRVSLPPPYTARYYAEKWGVFTAAVLIHTVGYVSLNKLYHPSHFVDVTTALDRAIPVRAEWSWFYEALFVMPICLAPIRDLARMWRAAAAVVATCVTAWVFFVLFPVSTEGFRPASVEVTDVHTLLLGFIYQTDGTGTCFPSLHVAISVLFGLIGMHQWKLWGHLLFLVGLLVSVSTLFTKQHYIADVTAGLLLAAATYRGVYHGAFLDRWARFRVSEGAEQDAREERAEPEGVWALAPSLLKALRR